MTPHVKSSGSDRLAPLRGRIAAVRRRRRTVRRLAAFSTLALAATVAVAALFVVDWFWLPPVAGRIALLAGAAITIVAFARRAAWPWLVTRESEADVALDIERRQGIDSDVVAALEFERAADAAGLGSMTLRDAVVAKVAAAAGALSIPADVPRAALGRRLCWAAAAAGLLAAAAVWKPDHARAFVSRMLLGAARYPTRTRIEELVIGGQRIDPRTSAAEVRMRIGSPLDVAVTLGGVVPPDCTLELVPSDGGPSRVPMPPAAGEAGGFAAVVPRLPESVKVRVVAGDTWSDPVTVRAVPAPLVDLVLSAEAPSYANPEGRVEQLPRGARQVVVLEGSRVNLEVRCSNKPLRSAVLVVDGLEVPLEPTDEAGGTWKLPADGQPLATVTRAVRCEVQVVDEDGLGPDVPLAATIRTRPDGAPRVTAEVQTRLVLPTGVPRVTWWATDDHALSRVELVLESLPAAEATGGEPREGSSVSVPLVAAADGGWLPPNELPATGRTPAPLSRLDLRKGDQVRILVRATDHRGGVEGRAVESDAVVLDVTDESGILAALSEADQRSAGQLDAIIERELSAGGTP